MMDSMEFVSYADLHARLYYTYTVFAKIVLNILIIIIIIMRVERNNKYIIHPNNNNNTIVQYPVRSSAQ